MRKAAEIQEPVNWLTLTGSAAEGYAWSAKASGIWALTAPANSKNLYSSAGLGAPGASFVLRSRGVTLDDAIEWRGRHCLITDIEPTDPQGIFVRITTAVVDIVQCASDGVTFPGVLTEKYMGHEQRVPMSVNVITYVLITPKIIALTPGHLVTAGGTDYEVLTAHTLDGHKNEYEIQRTVDL